MKKIILLFIAVLFLTGCGAKKEGLYTIDEFYSFAEDYNVENANTDIVRVEDEVVPTNSEIEGGGTQVKLNVYGLKEGTATVKYITIREDGEHMVTVYSFKVDNDLKPSLTNTDYYATFTEGHIFSHTHKLVVTDETIISIKEEMKETPSDVYTGGIAYLYTVTGLSEGGTDIIFEEYDDKGNLVNTAKYNCSVDDYLKVGINRINEEENSNN